MAIQHTQESWSEEDAEVIKHSFDAGAQAATWNQIRDFVRRLGPTHQDIAQKLGVSRSRVTQLLRSNKLLLDRLIPLIRNNGLSLDELSTNATAAVGGYVAAMDSARGIVDGGCNDGASSGRWPLTRTTLTQLHFWSSRCWTARRTPGSLAQIEAVIQEATEFIDRRRVLEKGRRRVEPFEGPMAKTTGEMFSLIEEWGRPWQVCNRYLLELWAKSALGWSEKHVREHSAGGDRY